MKTKSAIFVIVLILVAAGQGVVVPTQAQDGITVDAATRTVENAYIKIVWDLSVAERVTELYLKDYDPTYNLTGSYLGEFTGSAYYYSLSGTPTGLVHSDNTDNTWDYLITGEYVTISISSISPGGVGVSTTYKITADSPAISASRTFGFGDTAIDGIRLAPYTLRAYPRNYFTTFVYPRTDGTIALNTGSCEGGCADYDWDETWIDIEAPSWDVGLGLVNLLGNPSSYAWLDRDMYSYTSYVYGAIPGPTFDEDLTVSYVLYPHLGDYSAVDWDAVCPPFIEVNQALGRQYAGAQKYVAGKDTVIRVHLPEPVWPDAATQWVTVSRDDGFTATLKPDSNFPTDVLTFRCRYRSSCGNWGAGIYTFTASINGESMQKTASFQRQRSMHVLAVPIRLLGIWGVKKLPDDQWKTAGKFLQQVYPLSNIDGLDWTLGPELTFFWNPFWAAKKNKSALIMELLARQPVLCRQDSRFCYDDIIGFLPPAPICPEGSCSGQIGPLPGWTAEGYNAVAVTANGVVDCGGGTDPFVLDGMRATVAHEVGHTFGLGEEYEHPNAAYRCDVNPAPPSYGGRDPDDPNLDCVGSYSCSDQSVEEWPYGGGTGSLIDSAAASPYELLPTLDDRTVRGPLGDMLSFMGSIDQGNNWVTPRIYDRLFNELDPTRVTWAATRASERAVIASGWVAQSDGITLEPWHEVTMTIGSLVPGTYTIEAVDALSQTLTNNGFEVSFVDLSDPPMPVDPALFQVVVPFPDGTHAFRILQGESVLAVRQVSANKPTAFVTAPTSGELVAGEYAITWQSSDLDGDQLYHTVEYSHDGEDWLVLTSAITETQFTADFGALPGGDQAQLRLIVSDGINTIETTSEGFQVGSKSPEVFIESPADGARYAPGANATLYGSAYDLQDGWLRSASELEWSSNLDGVLGNGELLNLNDLSVGEHTITLAATNSLDMTSTGQVRVSIGGRQIYLPLILRKG